MDPLLLSGMAGTIYFLSEIADPQVSCFPAFELWPADRLHWGRSLFTLKSNLWCHFGREDVESSGSSDCALKTCPRGGQMWTMEGHCILWVSCESPVILQCVGLQTWTPWPLDRHSNVFMYMGTHSTPSAFNINAPRPQRSVCMWERTKAVSVIVCLLHAYCNRLLGHPIPSVSCFFFPLPGCVLF